MGRPRAESPVGWITASIARNGDPRDELIDAFAEEDYAHRILWYRFDDTKITVKKVPIARSALHEPILLEGRTSTPVHLECSIQETN